MEAAGGGACAVGIKTCLYLNVRKLHLGSDFGIEKKAAGKSEVVVRVKASPAGKYLFVDEFQEDVAKGQIVAE